MGLSTPHALLAQVENGYGQVVGIAGEPGIGKSRLLYEFCQQVRHKPYTFLAGRCVSYGQATPYLPLLDLLRQACSLTESDATEGVITKVRLSLQAVGMEPEEREPSLPRLLGREDGTAHLDTLSPQALRVRTFETLLQMQLRTSHQRPLLLEVEDVHWIDPTSEEWLMALVERLAGAPLLLLLSYRAGYQPAWMGKSYATPLALQRLTASLIVLGYPDQAVTRIREALTRAQELAHPYSLVYALMHAVNIHQLRLDIQAVQEHAEAMIAICEEQGELLLRQAMTNGPQAEACFQQALDLARRSQAKSWELRAAMSLSRLWQHQGKRDAARQLLAEGYGWFAEGFDTAALSAVARRTG